MFLSYLCFYSFKNSSDFSFLCYVGCFKFIDCFVVVFIVFLFLFSVFVLVIFPFFCFVLIWFCLFGVDFPFCFGWWQVFLFCGFIE
ncbi:hypothetical protein [Vibrio cholerae]|uniref:hypothetical protein n=1 Tax=Vibrio cholerae TaxID=666 RepID=UPI001C307DA0